MSQPYIGSIKLFAGNYAPPGWLVCNGQLLPPSSYSALFSLIGATYGGNGTTTFALPDLRDRIPVGAGASPASDSTYALGETFGSPSVFLLANQVPEHTHELPVTRAIATHSQLASGRTLAQMSADTPFASAEDGEPVQIGTTGSFGVGAPHENHMASLQMTFIIAVSGVFPPQP